MEIWMFFESSRMLGGVVERSIKGLPSGKKESD